MSKYDELVASGAPELLDGWFYTVSDDPGKLGFHQHPYCVTIGRRGRGIKAAVALNTLELEDVADACFEVYNLALDVERMTPVNPMIGNHGPED